MISDRTKQFIYNHLIKDLSNVEIIRHDESLWFIDREKKYWYLELVKTGKLYWRYQFFTEFFDMYSIDRDVYEPIIKEFVELVLNNHITTTAAAERRSNKPLEDALNNGITSTHEIVGLSNDIVDSVLNEGITSMGFTNRDKPFIVDSVLSNGITKITRGDLERSHWVKLVLTNGVTTKLRGGNATEQIKYVLTDDIISTGSNRLLSHTKLDLILKKGVGDLIPLNAYRENMINYVLKDNLTNE